MHVLILQHVQRRTVLKSARKVSESYLCHSQSAQKN